MKLSGKSTYLSLIYILFYLPIAVLIAYSFNNAVYSLQWHGFTLHWYKQLFQNSSLWSAAINSLVLATAASLIATAIGALAAVSLYRYRFLGKPIIYALVFILILAPDIVMGIALLILYNMASIPLGFSSLLLAHITFCLPFVIVMLSSRLAQVDKNIFIAAQDLGAKDSRIFTRIILPLLGPSLISAALLCFTLSFDDVIISYFVSGPGFDILPLHIYGMIRTGIKPEINALCTIIFMLTLVLIVLSQMISNKK